LTSTHCSGSYKAGLCPGPANVQCCQQSASTPGVGASCPSGTCQLTSSGCSGHFVAGLCPGPSNVQCCQKSSSPTPGVGASCPGGTCQLTSSSCSGGSYVAGLCPGAANVQCCQKGGQAPPPPTGTGAARRAKLVACGQDVYNNRYNMHYTEGSQRWSGIQDRIYPPSAPPYSDCSSTITWCYWTIFGGGPDFVNNDNWQGGYTGTMATSSQLISCSDMQPGDIILYGSGYPWDHVEMYMGNGQTISHGADPASYESSTSDQGFDTFQCRTYPQVNQ